MSSMLSIHKEIEKKKYAESPLGKLEKELGQFYDGLQITKRELPTDVLEQVNRIRSEHEKAQTDYIDMTLKRDRQAVDDMLFKAMTDELAILQKIKW